MRCGGEIIVGFAMWRRASQQRDDARDAAQDPEHCDVGQAIRQILQNCRFVLSPLADRSKLNLGEFLEEKPSPVRRTISSRKGKETSRKGHGPSAPFL